MKKKIALLLSVLLLGLLLLPLTAPTAYAKDYDEIVSYIVTVEPDVDDGSLRFIVSFNWKALEELPHGEKLKIGIPNGAIREVKALSGDIERLNYDNSYIYVYMKRAYAAGETFSFSYSWVQEYMYTLEEDGSVSYDYTPGWFDEAKVDRMTVVWIDPAGLEGTRSFSATKKSLWRQEGNALVAENLGHGHKINVKVTYPRWPTDLAPEHSIENIPGQYSGDAGASFTPYRMVSALIRIVIIVIVISFVLNALRRAGRGSYSGGFGTHYVFFNNLWYPAGPDGKPKPGSTGTVHKPKPSSASGFGGGKRGGGFGGGGFGGGSRCACASSCACACACACAGGGRAGCSAKNLYGAVLLDEEMSRKLMADGE